VCQRTTWFKNVPEILKIIRDRPKINKSGLKRSAGPGKVAKQNAARLLLPIAIVFVRRFFEVSECLMQFRGYERR
jgi:hypothetical protein